MAKKKAETAKAKSKVLVTLILDRSGSMSNARKATVEGINEYFHGLREDKETEYSISLIQFDLLNAGPELLLTYDDKLLSAVTDLKLEEYEPRGSTPLYDAVGECIRRVDLKGRNSIAVVITDGYENASKEFTKENIRELIKAKEAEGWTFVFLGADIDAMQQGMAMGAQAANSVGYSKANTMRMFESLSDATVNRSAAYRAFDSDEVVRSSFLSDKQKQDMVQPNPTVTTSGSSVTHFVTGTTVLPHGGPSPAQPTFPDKTRKRDWTVSQPGGDSSGS